MTFLEGFKAFIAALGAWAHKYIGGVFMEMKDGKPVVSIGRISFLVVLSVMIWVWCRSITYEGVTEMPPQIMNVFYILAGYVFGSKVVGVIQQRLNGNKPK